MKNIFISFFILVSCNTVKFSRPDGAYVCGFENEFSKVADTLVLQKLNDKYYTIIRHSGVTNNNKKQLITEAWKLEFDKIKNVFTEMRLGKIIIWDEDKQILIFGNRAYKKQ